VLYGLLGAVAPALLSDRGTMKHRKRRERGFTLIELLVVMAILFIALMIATPYLSKQIERSKIVSVANQVAGLMRLARLHAIKMSSEVGCVAVQGDAVEAFSSSDDCATRLKLLGQVPLPKSMTASITGFSPSSVATFRSDGSALEVGSVDFLVAEMGGGVHCMRVSVQPRATARVQVLKKDISNAWGGPPWNWAPVGSCP